MQVRLKKLNEQCVLPQYQTAYSAGADVHASESVEIGAGETKLIGTGFAIELPEGYAGFIFARSGLATKRGLAPANKVGVIDSDYRGEVKVALHNHSKNSEKIEVGDRIAQLVIMPIVQAQFEEASDISETARGEGGFGSTGTK